MDVRELAAEVIARALEEDLGPGDVTTLATVPADRAARGTFLAKEPGVVAGLAIVDEVFRVLDESVVATWSVSDGESVTTQQHLGVVEGPARALLSGERVALNLLQRMSGIATATRAMVEAARPARVLDTRKTAPGLRALDKWAVRMGGGENHRMGLFDRILIKDNHIAAAGGVRAAVDAAERFRSSSATGMVLEVEARTLDEVEEVLASPGVDWILLDNMVHIHDDGLVEVSMLQEAVRQVGGRLITEASGNVTLETVPAIAATGVDYISSGALTHSVRALDISLGLEISRATSRER